MSSDEEQITAVADDGDMFHDGEHGTEMTDDGGGQAVTVEEEVKNVAGSNNISEVKLNPLVVIDSNNNCDPASLVGIKLSSGEKEFISKSNPCQPAESELKKRCKQIENRVRYCSQVRAVLNCFANTILIRMRS